VHLKSLLLNIPSEIEHLDRASWTPSPPRLNRAAGAVEHHS